MFSAGPVTAVGLGEPPWRVLLGKEWRTEGPFLPAGVVRGSSGSHVTPGHPPCGPRCGFPRQPLRGGALEARTLQRRAVGVGLPLGRRWVLQDPPPCPQTLPCWTPRPCPRLAFPPCVVPQQRCPACERPSRPALAVLLSATGVLCSSSWVLLPGAPGTRGLVSQPFTAQRLGPCPRASPGEGRGFPGS